MRKELSEKESWKWIAAQFREHGPRAPKKMAMTATAYHEAGHAVVCQRLGFRVQRVTIVPSVTFAGQCTHENILRGIDVEFDGSDRCRIRIEKLIMVCLAGMQAQRMWRPRSVRNYHAASDHRAAVDMALRCNGSGPQATAHLKWLSIRTESILKFLWPAVEAMAEDLLRDGTITPKR